MLATHYGALQIFVHDTRLHLFTKNNIYIYITVMLIQV